jgi:Tfp pilus assembly protein PilO
MRLETLFDRKWIVLASLAVALAVLVIVVDVLPRSVSVARQAMELRAQLSSVEPLSELQERLHLVRSERAVLEEEIVSIASESCESCIAGVLTQVRALLEQESLDLVQIRPGSATQTETTVSTPVELDVVGSYHSLGRFIDSVEELNEIIRFVRVSVSEGEVAGALEARLSLHVVTLRDRS